MIHRVRRPSRYIDGEWGAVHKDDARVRIALAFPDTYEVGMSHLGLKILYGLINDIPQVSAERVFAPWFDGEAELRRSGTPLSTLESGLPLSRLDAVGFSLQYELGSTNVLAMLDLGGIPLRVEDRSSEDPIVLAGGPCAMNPGPLSSFVDAFVLGDGEDTVPRIVSVFLEAEGRHDRLRGIAEIPGVFVPSVQGFGARVSRQIVEDLESAYYPTRPVVAHQAVHDRVAIEIGRGCPRGCRFCQAGMIYRPLRERSVDTILNLAEEAIRNTGYRELSFTSLSAGDYCDLGKLLREANRLFSGRHVGLSLPSIRVGSLDREIVREIKSERKSGFTIAPEAGTDRLRSVINKDITDADFFQSLELLFGEGWDQIKLYFMIGLPTETQEDLDGIVRMVREGLRIGKAARKKSVQFNVGVSSFVPKSHTPFQWEGQLPLDELRRRQDWLRNSLPRRQAHFKGQKVELSALEAVLSRGGPQTGELIEQAFREGCRFDAWTEGFDFAAWERAMQRVGVGWEAAERKNNPGSMLPWANVDPGFSEEFLARERMRALSGTMTDECRKRCSACGLECGDARVRVPGQASEDEARGSSGEQGGEELRRRKPGKPSGPPVSAVFRLRYSRKGMARFLSHRETMDVVTRSFHRGAIPLEYSQGFHPHPRLSFGPPLSVGVESEGEYIDLRVCEVLGAEEILSGVGAVLPEGFTALQCRGLHGGAPSLGKFIVRYDYLIQAAFPGPLVSPLVVKRDGGEDWDVSKSILGIDEAETGFVLRLVDQEGSQVRLAEILTALGLELGGEEELRITRVGLWGRRGSEWVSPMDKG